MPRYHFHVRSSSDFVEDAEGRELPGPEAARREAVKGIRSILSEEIARGRIDLRGRVEVVDDAGAPVLTVPFAAAVDLYFDDPPIT